MEKSKEQVEKEAAELQAALAALKIREEKLEEEARLKNLFIDVLAHELRTPLTSVLVAIDMLTESPEMGDDFKQRLLSTISSSSKQLAKRLDELLDLARYSKGTFKLNQQPTDVYRYMEETRLRFEPVLKLYRQNLELDIAADIPEITLDQSRIEQVLVNLLTNAGKYSSADQTIKLKVSYKDRRLLIEVKDHGVGISAEDQKHIFQPYYRAAQDPRIPGIGLGLAVSRLIVEAHGGQIQVTSQPGEGSTFSLTLPA